MGVASLLTTKGELIMNTHTSDQPTVADDPKAREALRRAFENPHGGRGISKDSPPSSPSTSTERNSRAP